jgi:PiT family inorganic phosphate transporter
MADSNTPYEKPTLDKDLEKYTFIESATQFVLKRAAPPGLGLIFLSLSALLATLYVTGNPDAAVIVAASAIAAYMAMNIGANDVTNNIGAAVGARAISMAAALLLAAACEIAGAMLAGGEVVATIKTGIVAPSEMANPGDMITIMMSALLAAALWINLATWLNAPVSTTHSIVGAVLGSSVVVLGFGAIKWGIVGSIAVAWLLSPLISALVAIAFLWFIKDRIIYATDKVTAAKTWVPVLLAIMTGAFSSFLLLKIPNHLVAVNVAGALAAGSLTGLASHVFYLRRIRAAAKNLENRNQSLKILFRMPLILAAALLSFAHGANDVANAIGPLAAIVEAAGIRSVATNLDAPFWVMLIGALGISVGLLLFGPRLIRVVGEQITKLNPMRAFCVSISAAITVIVASVLGLPVSSTHVAVGAVFGVGFFREWYTARSLRRQAYIDARSPADAGTAKVKKKEHGDDEEDRESENSRYRFLVRRSHLMTIMAAWLVTVPVSGLISALVTAILLAIDF